ncbi:unnamed protein product [Closterium sp. NIES-64]|nr:unnamed protein product [Closterium sp. NIES-64]
MAQATSVARLNVACAAPANSSAAARPQRQEAASLVASWRKARVARPVVLRASAQVQAAPRVSARSVAVKASAGSADEAGVKYHFVVANATFMLDEEEHFQEQLKERLRWLEEKGTEQNFWLVFEPKFLDEFPEIAKRVKRPAVALVSTDATWITFMKLRLDRVLKGEFEASSQDDALEGKPFDISFPKPANWVAPYPKYEPTWWKPYAPAKTPVSRFSAQPAARNATWLNPVWVRCNLDGKDGNFSKSNGSDASGDVSEFQSLTPDVRPKGSIPINSSPTRRGAITLIVATSAALGAAGLGLGSYMFSSPSDLADSVNITGPSSTIDPASLSPKQRIALRVGNVSHTEAEWREVLSPGEYYVLREAGTERSFTSDLLYEKRPGTFVCRGCGSPLFNSETKFESGTGWPSFFDVLPGAVDLLPDRSFFGFDRTEVRCSQCQGHLGHVFEDGPAPTGLRYCMNGLALGFQAKDNGSVA